MSKQVRISMNDYDSSTEPFEKSWTFDVDAITYADVAKLVGLIKEQFGGYHLSTTERARDPKPARVSPVRSVKESA